MQPADDCAATLYAEGVAAWHLLLGRHWLRRTKIARPQRRPTREEPHEKSCCQFIINSAAAAGGLAVGFSLPFGANTQSATAGVEVDAWVVVKPDETCVLRFQRTEMGQGTRTGIAQLIAEELDCDWNRIAVESVTPRDNLARKRLWD